MRMGKQLATVMLTAFCALTATLALMGGSALALESHAFSKAFGGEGEHALSDPQGVAIQQSTGEVYVVDGGHDRVELFDAEGNFLRAFGSAGNGEGQFREPTQIAIDNSTGLPGDVYVLDPPEDRIEVFNAKGEYLRQVTREDIEPTALKETQTSPGSIEAIGVDDRGDLWIATASHLVLEFPPGGQPPGLFGTSLGGGASIDRGFAIDSNGDLYGPDGNVVRKFESDGVEVEQLDYLGAGGPSAVVVDPASQDLYVDNGTSVAHFLAPDTASTLNDTFGQGGPGALAGSSGIAVAAESGDVYVTDAARSRVDVFVPATLAETTVEPASGAVQTGAVLHGAVNPDATTVSACDFEWGTSPGALTNTAACAPSPPYTGGTAQSVQAKLEGLAAAGTYYYRLAATNAEGTSYSATESLTTPPAVQGLSTGGAEAVTASGAKLTGTLSPEGTDAHYYFEYGTDPTPEGSCEAAAGCFESPAFPPGVDAGTGGASCHPPGGSECSPVSAETAIGGLTANTVYHYRLVGTDVFGTTYGADNSFKTPGPPVVQSSSAEVAPESKAGQTSAVLQAQITPDGRETTYTFEYGETSAYGASVPASPEAIGSGENPVSVPATEVTGLKLGATYHFRVVASNEYGTVAGPDETFTTLAATLVTSSATNVTATSVTLHVDVNPLGSDTTCRFEYLTGVSFEAGGYRGAIVVPCPAELGEGEARVSESIHLQGLAPAVVYHYRVTAINALGTVVESPDHAFVTQAAGTEVSLPDGREWEMVTPPNKQGSLVLAIGQSGGDEIQAAQDGGGIAYGANAPFVANPAGSRSIELTQVLSQRAAPGVWSTQDITTPHDDGATASIQVGHTAEYKLFSSDLSLGLVEPAGNTPLPPLPAGSEKTIYLREADGGFEGLVTKANVPPGCKFGGDELDAGTGVGFVDGTPDMRHVILGTNQNFGPVCLSSGVFGGSYEWSEGELRPIGVLPGGEVVEGGLAGVRHALSNDGSRVVWYGSGGLYLRDMLREETVRLPFSEGGEFQIANTEGSRVFYTNQRALYVFQVTSGSGEALAGESRKLAEGGIVEGVVGASDDGSYVYFVDSGVLGDGAEHGAQNGGANLYLDRYDEATKSWQPATFIALLSDEDSPSWGQLKRQPVTLESERDPSSQLISMTSRVSPNGRYMAFMSDRSLTGYDNRDTNSGVPDEEVFLYDADAGRLRCASCDPTGARPTGIFRGGEVYERLVDFAGIWENRWLAGNVPGWTGNELGRALYQSRYLSDSGRLFFDSSDALVPADIDGKEDVYEYEPVGVGGCQPPGYGQSATDVFVEAAGGCVALISAGTSSEESAFMDASESGGDVFFLTHSRLSLQDYDTAFDIYDAHECSAGAPCAPPGAVPPPPCTTGDSCKAAPSPQPAIYGSPSSETFTGAGNVAPSATSSSAVRGRPLSRGQKLARALQACARQSRRKRTACRLKARERFGARSSAAAKRSSSGRRG
jgi:6-bladed beta-propeller